MNRILLLSLLLLAACDTNRPEPYEPEAVGLLSIDGGNFSDQDGTITRIDLVSGASDPGPSMNGFLQGAVAFEGGLAVLVNTFSDGRVDFLAPDARTLLRSATGFGAPRAVVVLDGSVFVSAFSADGSGRVVRIDPATAAIQATWALPGSYPEGIAVTGGRIVVALHGFLGDGTLLAVIDPAAPSVATVKALCDGPRDLVATADDGLAVVCAGRTVYSPDWSQVVESTPSRVVFFSAAARSVLRTITLDGQVGGSNGTPATVWLDRKGQLVTLDGANDRIVRIGTDSFVVSTQSLPPGAPGVGLSALAYDAASDRLFVARLARGVGGVPDFSARGSVLALEADGALAGVWTVGIAPSALMLLQ